MPKLLFFKLIKLLSCWNYHFLYLFANEQSHTLVISYKILVDINKMIFSLFYLTILIFLSLRVCFLFFKKTQKLLQNDQYVDIFLLQLKMLQQVKILQLLAYTFLFCFHMFDITILHLFFLQITIYCFSIAIFISQMSQDKIPKKADHHFPTTKIKRIIQENQEIGKLSNLVPPLVESSLEIFLLDLLKKAQQVALQHNTGKLTPTVLKQALLSLPAYEFMRDTVQDVEQIINKNVLKSKSSGQKSLKRTKSGASNNSEGVRGRKKAKNQEEHIQPLQDAIEQSDE